MNHEYWQHRFETEKFYSYEALSERTGVPIEELYIFKDESTEPLGILIQRELETMNEETMKYTDSVNDIEKKFDIRFSREGLKALKRAIKDYETFDVSIFRNMGTGSQGEVTDLDVDTVLNQQPKPVYSWHPSFIAWVDECLQETYERTVSNAFWVATFYNPEREWNYIPDEDAVTEVFGMVFDTDETVPEDQRRVGMQNYVYDYDNMEPDPTRHGVSETQYERIMENQNRIIQGQHSIDVVMKAGFHVHTSFEDAYEKAKARSEDRQLKQREAKAASKARAQQAAREMVSKFGTERAALFRANKK